MACFICNSNARETLVQDICNRCVKRWSADEQRLKDEELIQTLTEEKEKEECH